MFFAEDLAGNQDSMATEEDGNQIQTGSSDQDDSYTFMWGKNQALVKQSDGNTFVINIERDGDFYPQYQDSDYVNRNFDTNVHDSVEAERINQTGDNTSAYTDMQPCSLLLPAERLSSDLEYCGLDLLADLCEQKTRSVVPDSSTEKDLNGNIVRAIDLQTAVGFSSHVDLDVSAGFTPGVTNASENLEVAEVSNNTPVCKIVDSYSLAPSSDVRPM